LLQCCVLCRDFGPERHHVGLALARDDDAVIFDAATPAAPIRPWVVLVDWQSAYGRKVDMSGRKA
jgi:hypothetical protein